MKKTVFLNGITSFASAPKRNSTQDNITVSAVKVFALAAEFLKSNRSKPTAFNLSASQARRPRLIAVPPRNNSGLQGISFGSMQR